MSWWVSVVPHPYEPAAVIDKQWFGTGCGVHDDRVRMMAGNLL